MEAMVLLKTAMLGDHIADVAITGLISLGLSRAVSFIRASRVTLIGD
jgi:hypothetical protein